MEKVPSTKQTKATSPQGNKSRLTGVNRAKNSKQKSNIQRVPVPASVGLITSQKNNKSMKTHTVPHTEYVMDVNGSNLNFEVQQTLVLNPGNPDLFPWLSAMGNLYESYRFKKLKLRYAASCSTQTNGFVGLVPDFNPLDPSPSSKTLAFQNEKTKRGSSFTSFEVNCSQEELNKRKSYFCRGQNETVPNANREVYDTGNVYLIVGGQGHQNPIGELWIDFEVEFMTPEPPTILPIAAKLVNPDGGSQTVLNPLGVGGAAATEVSQPDGVTFSTDATASVINFLKPFSGNITAYLNGTGLGNLATFVGGGAAFSGGPSSAVTNSAGTGALMNLFITSPAGGSVRTQIASMATGTFSDVRAYSRPFII